MPLLKEILCLNGNSSDQLSFLPVQTGMFTQHLLRIL